MRSGPSGADRLLTSQLAARDVIVSAAQLERWRAAELLPRNERHGRGRGRGSWSAASQEAVAIAAALSRHARQGRDLRRAVIDWFAEAGQPVMPGEPVVPEPPFTAVRSALEWITAGSPEYRLFQLARAARTDDEKDRFYQAAAGVTRSMTMAPVFDTATIRAALTSRQDIPGHAFRSGPQIRSAAIQLIAATGMGHAEVGADALAEAAADSGMAPASSPADWQQLLTRLDNPASGAAGALADILITRYDPLQMLSLTNAELLQQARTTARGLAGIGAFFFFHALLMPDTPGQKELRATATALGMKPIAMAIMLGIHTTGGFASAVVSCLHPFYTAFHKLLSDHAASQPLIADTPEDVGEFMATWLTSMKRVDRSS
jgi:hypothetical protein